MVWHAEMCSCFVTCVCLCQMSLVVFARLLNLLHKNVLRNTSSDLSTAVYWMRSVVLFYYYYYLNEFLRLLNSQLWVWSLFFKFDWWRFCRQTKNIFSLSLHHGSPAALLNATSQRFQLQRLWCLRIVAVVQTDDVKKL